MTERTRTVSTLVLCTVLAAALVMIVLALPGLEEAPAPIDVALDFDTFVPGVPQVETRVLDVPVPSRVREAGVSIATGFARDIEWIFELCRGNECRPLAVGDVVEPGVHRLQVTALLDEATAPGASGQVAGRVLLAESSSTPAVDRSQLVWLATIGLIGMVLVATVLHRTRMVSA